MSKLHALAGSGPDSVRVSSPSQADSNFSAPVTATAAALVPDERRADAEPQSRTPLLHRLGSPLQTPGARRASVAIALLLLVAGAGTWYGLNATAAPEGLIQANGRIESDVVNVSSKLAGRIVSLGAREGDVVKAGATIARLDDRTLDAQLQEAVSALATATARLDSARVSLAVMRKEVPVEISMAAANVNAARAAASRAQASESQYQRDAERAQRLFNDGSLPQQSAEQADLNWRNSRDQRLAAQADLARLEEAGKNAQLGPDRIRAREAELLSMDAARREAEARVSQAQSAVDDLQVVSPIDAVVTSRFVNAGEVVNAGMPLLELVDLDRLYLKVYVPEKEIGKVRRGLPARIYSDAFPGEPFDATVRYIGSRAEFTPKEVQTPDERTKLVYEVRLYLTRNPDHKLTPGLPADAVIRWKEDAAWQPPRW